jgi:hypothetical protein
VGGRSAGLVLLTGIVGVPWQDVARDPSAPSKGLRTAAEMIWPVVLGDPATGAPPLDPLMVESIDPRTGKNPATGAALAPPSAGAMANPINGHERTIGGRDDLQYACIYARLAPAACTTPPCECDAPTGDPVCQASDGSYGKTQLYARALPGVRELELLQKLGERAAVGSVCAAPSAGEPDPGFGYKPSLDAALRLLRTRLE